MAKLRPLLPDNAPYTKGPLALIWKLLMDAEVRAVSLTLIPVRSSAVVATTVNGCRYPWCVLSSKSGHSLQVTCRLSCVRCMVTPTPRWRLLCLSHSRCPSDPQAIVDEWSSYLPWEGSGRPSTCGVDGGGLKSSRAMWREGASGTQVSKCLFTSEEDGLWDGLKDGQAQGKTTRV